MGLVYDYIERQTTWERRDGRTDGGQDGRENKGGNNKQKENRIEVEKSTAKTIRQAFVVDNDSSERFTDNSVNLM